MPSLMPAASKNTAPEMIVGIGTDIVEIDRIRSMLERHGTHFSERCFTPTELAWADKQRDSAPRIAGRWAAKEAVVKALGTGFIEGMTFHDIEVLPLHTGQPAVKLSGRAADIASQLGIHRVLITISHARNYATATAVAVDANG